ncbi:hypothetical protein LUZ61_004821 [Rhynchospora tenuis]|uniref:Dirigent protein n=1 Tax=Rhynchospora tenuis TaxID=198213 RepID=A0AAD5ZNF0_9POAL|nr:hypothetical protein LUZ61_004821 [Rhynchospora tenuis]
MAKSTFKIAQVPPNFPLQQTEFYFHLYLHHTYAGPNRNQSSIATANQPFSFGNINVNDWPLYDGPGSDAKLVARAQGLHIQSGMRTGENWYNALSIVFEDARFKGSSLQVVGAVVERGEWAIVGGTGEFTLAQGVIYKTFYYQNRNLGNVIELDIHGFYLPMRVGTSFWSLGV